MTLINENKMNISETDAWGTILAEVPLELGEGEHTINTLIELYQGRVSISTMQTYVSKWLKEGKIESVGKRRYNGRICNGYRVVI